MAKPSVEDWQRISELGLSEMSTESDIGLGGRRVVVTRAAPQGAPLVSALEAAGAIPVNLPLLEILDATDGGEALRKAVTQLVASDWLVVLSPNGARRVVGLSLPSTVPNLAVLAGGTGRVFAQAGWPANLIPEVASSKGLLEAFTDVAFYGRVLIAQAEVGRSELADGLRARGVEVEVVAAYRNVMPELDASAVVAAADADVVVFASPSAVDRYVEHVALTPKRAVCIGAVTAEAARGFGFDVEVSKAPAIDAIVRAVAGT